MMQAPTRQEALADIDRFVAEFSDKYPKAPQTLTKDQDLLLTYFDYPAAHWVHLRTTNPIESPFATVKQRLKQTKGTGRWLKRYWLSYGFQATASSPE